MLDVMRQWNKKLPDVEDFWMVWLRHENAEERLVVYEELREWGRYCCDCQDIELMMDRVCYLWERIQQYEKEHPEEPKFKDLAEADVKFEVMWDMRYK